MSDARELSRFRGQPVRLFIFMRQHLVWRYCTADRDLVIGGVTYLSGQIDRDEIRQTAERAKDQLKITLAYLRDPTAPEFPNTQPLGDNWHPYAPSDTIRVVCMATHLGDTAPPMVEWMGIVTQPNFSDTELELTCDPGSAIAQAVGQGPMWQKSCWKTPYSTGLRGCNMPLDGWKVDAVLTSANGLIITAPQFAAAPLPLEGGWFEWVRADGLIDRRSIMAHTGNTIQLLYGAADLGPGFAGIARPTCPGNWAACLERNNTPNYGGAIYKPIKPPTGDSMSWG